MFCVTFSGLLTTCFIAAGWHQFCSSFKVVRCHLASSLLIDWKSYTPKYSNCYNTYYYYTIIEVIKQHNLMPVMVLILLVIDWLLFAMLSTLKLMHHSLHCDTIFEVFFVTTTSNFYFRWGYGGVLHHGFICLY